MDDTQIQTTLNIPSLLIFGLISVFAIRYFFFTSPNAPRPGSNNDAAAQTYPGGANSSARRHVTIDKINLVASMFPQLSRRDIEWDLVRNGGSVQGTSDRVLRDGRLEPAPPNFRATPDPATANPVANARARAQPQQKPEFQDLITRYGLSSKVAELAANASSAAVSPADDAIQTKEVQKEKGGWSSNKDQRHALLKKRRDDMILAARKKLEERDRAAKV